MLPAINLQQRSKLSFWTASIPALADLLQARGYELVPTRNQLLEYARLRKDDSLIVLYNSGSVVVQGNDIEAGYRALSGDYGWL